ncbi:MAG: propionate CoA-transferase [Porticoccaceae bacterium]
MKDKLIGARAAVERIRPRDTLCISGFVGTGTPEALIKALEGRFLHHGAPFDLTLVFAAAPGDGKERGVNRLAHPGLLKRVIGGHWALVPKLGELALSNAVEAYNLPLGVMSALYREIASKRGGVLTKIGLGTFVDPRQGGGRLNRATWEELVKLVTVDDEEWLLYRPFPIDVAFIRGTTADRNGNLSMEKEALTLDSLAIATATRNCGGLVIAQVERVVDHPLPPRVVEVPGILVDHLVEAAPEDHRQTWATQYDPAFAGQRRLNLAKAAPLPLDERKLIARRAAFELPLGGVINLGIGMPEGVARVASEEGLLDTVTLTAEPGIIGGMPQSGLDFGAAVNNDALLQQNQQFDFYDGGGLDLAVLGMAQVDARGNVNVSRFGRRLAGAGGFINISQTTRRLVFVGSFTTGGLEVAVTDRELCIVREGALGKFVSEVEQVTFNGELARRRGQSVLYITERAVFRLGEDGLEVVEVAPGIDLERDVLAQLPFPVSVCKPRPMNPCLFGHKAMGLARLLGVGAERRPFAVAEESPHPCLMRKRAPALATSETVVTQG